MPDRDSGTAPPPFLPSERAQLRCEILGVHIVSIMGVKRGKLRQIGGERKSVGRLV